MTAKEFKQALKMAKDFSLDFSDIPTVPIGYGLHGFPVSMITLKMAAKEIRYHCLFLNGEWDFAALEETKKTFRRVFQIIPS